MELYHHICLLNTFFEEKLIYNKTPNRGKCNCIIYNAIIFA